MTGPPLRVLQFVGSPTSVAYRELSELYARGALAALSGDGRFRFFALHVSPDGAWRLPAGLRPEDVAAATPTSLAKAIGKVEALAIDLALPQLFCPRGMTEMRALLDLMGLPYLGNRPLQTALAADKALAKAVVAAAGVATPRAAIVRPGDAPPRIERPAVVKPIDADNSEGASFVTRDEDLPRALAAAFAHGAAALVEDYVPLGREVRCGVIERGDGLFCLPLEEYFVDEDERPIRRAADKLKRDAAGNLYLGAKTRAESWIVPLDDPIVAPVHAAARAAYAALGGRHYNLFDFRVDPENRPWFLESGPYCSFSPQSVIVAMAEAAGIPLRELFAETARLALGRRPE